MVSDAILIMIALGASLILEWIVLRIARGRNLLAEVNARSSHHTPTPTMGGIVICLLVLAYLLYLDLDMAWGLAACLAIVGLAGLWDDLRPLSARVRLFVQFIAAGGVVWLVTPEIPLVIGLLAIVAICWFTNLFNFMDGIDGIAAVQCLVFCIGVQFLTGGVTGWAGDLLWITGAATLGFLAFNWPPAKIFMGDVGSAFLGLLIATMTIYLWYEGLLPLIASLILLAGFWFDATYTLCVRIVTRQSFTEAHRSHLYQRLAGRYGHLRTTTAFLGFAVLWSLPLAWMSIQYPTMSLLILVVTLIPLAFLCYLYQAGTRQETN